MVITVQMEAMCRVITILHQMGTLITTIVQETIPTPTMDRMVHLFPIAPILIIT